ncbi:ABC transporter ATP-binding protein [archaeon]|nr:ABC transporter ATP-binding protein [archaeon]
MSKNKISVQNLSKEFRSNGRVVAALKGLSFEVREGEFFGIVGPSGCGKTTLLNIIGGIERPTGGSIQIDGSEIKGPGFDRGMLFQEGALLPWRTSKKNVEFGLEIKGADAGERAKIADKYLKLVGLEGFEESYPHELSMGMVQRVSLARVLSFDPDILLMDEPFASVDALTREGLQNELLKIWTDMKKTIVFVTHSIDEAVYLSDRIAVLSARPGRAKEVVEITLPRPRDRIRTSQEFAHLREKIEDILKEEIGNNEH